MLKPDPACRRGWRAAVGALAVAAASAAAGEQAPHTMSLPDAVRAAVANSRAIRDARLARASDHLDLRLAQDQFRPDLIVSSGLYRNQTWTNPHNADDTFAAGYGADVQAAVRMAIPTGGEVVFVWDGATSRENDRGGAAVAAEHGHGWQVDLVQPLLRGGGVTVGMAELSTARLADRQSALALGQDLMSVVTRAILTFRDLARAGRELEIVRGSLADARQLAEVNSALIDAGRMAPVDLVQTETEVANKEVDVLVAENRVEAARLALVDVLDLPVGTVIEPAYTPSVAVAPPDRAVVEALALERRPDLLSAQLDAEIAALELTVAANDRLPDLNLAATYGGAVAHPLVLDDSLRDRGWSTGLMLGYTFGDVSRSVRYGQAKIAVERAEVAVRELEDRVRLEVANRVREVGVLQRGVDLARRARELSERQLEVEGEKLRVGRSSNFEYLRLQSDLVAARARELAAAVAYLDALTLLDETIGTTLDTWGITVEALDREAP
jgi:outer membrane protein TolC